MICDKLDSEPAEAPLTGTQAGAGGSPSPSQATLVNEPSGWVAARGLQYLDLALGPYTLLVSSLAASADVSYYETRSFSSEAATTGTGTGGHRQPERLGLKLIRKLKACLRQFNIYKLNRRWSSAAAPPAPTRTAIMRTFSDSALAAA